MNPEESGDASFFLFSAIFLNRKSLEENFRKKIRVWSEQTFERRSFLQTAEEVRSLSSEKCRFQENSPTSVFAGLHFGMLKMTFIIDVKMDTLDC